MRLGIKVAMVFTAVLALAIVALRYALPEYDGRTRAKILQSINLELPAGANELAMEGYMRRHTASFSVDDRFNHRFEGVVEQTWLDRMLAARKVIIRLRFDHDRAYGDAEVLVTYTLP
jgi:hypothetical protein